MSKQNLAYSAEPGGNHTRTIKGRSLEIVSSWVKKGQLPGKAETRGKASEVLVARFILDPVVCKMKDEVLMFTKAADRKQI